MKRGLTIEINGRVEKVAANWDELSSNEYLKIANYLFECVTKQIDYINALRNLLTILLHQQPFFFLDLYNSFAEDVEGDAELQTAAFLAYEKNLFAQIPLDWILKRSEAGYEIQYNRFRLWEEVRTIKLNNDVYYGPADRLDNITFWEWVFISPLIENYINQYNLGNAEAAEDSLDMVFAALWRPKAQHIVGKNDMRESLQDNDLGVSSRAKVWAKHREKNPYAAQVIRRGLWFWLSCCRMSIIAKYKESFENSGGGATDYTEMFMSIAGSWDKADLLAKTNVHIVLADLNLKLKHASK